LPQLGAPSNIEAYRVYEKELQRRQAAVEHFLSATELQLRDELRVKSGLYLPAVSWPDPKSVREQRSQGTGVDDMAGPGRCEDGSPRLLPE